MPLCQIETMVFKTYGFECDTASPKRCKEWLEPFRVLVNDRQGRSVWHDEGLWLGFQRNARLRVGKDLFYGEFFALIQRGPIESVDGLTSINPQGVIEM